MKIKKIQAILSTLFFISSITQAHGKCIKQDFWTTWFNKGQFKGFGISPSKNEISKAQYELAENYYLGKVVSKNYSKAIDLFDRASKDGLSQAHFRLGLINHYGQGKVKNLQQAFQHYQIAAQKNDTEAQFN